MGQPIQTLTAHVGQPQLWNWSASVPPAERFFAGYSYRSHVAVRLVFLMFQTFPKLFNNHLWLSSVSYFTHYFRRNAWKSTTQKIPNIFNKPYIYNRYFRFQPGELIFKENDVLYIETDYNKVLPHSNYIWTHVRLFCTKKTTLFWLRGIPYDQDFNYLTLYETLRSNKQIDATPLWEYHLITKTGNLAFLENDAWLTAAPAIRADQINKTPPVLWF